MSSDDEVILRHGVVCETSKNAAQDAGRAINSVTLCAVSKTFSAEAIAPVIDVGQKVFGENRVQEAEG